MAGEIQLNSTTFATESGGTITVANVDSATNRQNLGLEIGVDVQAFDADTTKNDVANTFTANQIISVTDNTNAALRVTQLGTGNALVVEDSTNPDSSPFVVDASGNVGVGTSSPDAAVHAAGSSNSKIIRARQNYYQVHVSKNISSTTNCLSIVFPGTEQTAATVKVVTTVQAPGYDAMARTEEFAITKYSSVALTLTSKQSQGNSGILTGSISGNSVIFAYPYLAVSTQNCRSYFEIMGIYGQTSEGTFTVNIL